MPWQVNSWDQTLNGGMQAPKCNSCAATDKSVGLRKAYSETANSGGCCKGEHSSRYAEVADLICRNMNEQGLRLSIWIVLLERSNNLLRDID